MRPSAKSLSKNTSLFPLGLIVLTVGLCCNPTQSNEKSTDIDRYFSALATNNQAPEVYDVKIRENGITEFYLDGEDYLGKPTRFFALYRPSSNSISLPSGKSPAIVLVHGGGGTAFEEWLEKWNNIGFAAMSIAVEGQTDTLIVGKTKQHWQRHAYSGPARVGIYEDAHKPIKEQWIYHAVSAVIRARNFLESTPQIDSDHIGLSGISWGGIITSTVIGFDPGFDFAIPVYGCGFLDTIDNQYKRALSDNDVYRKVWEPANRIAKFTNPSLWLTWRDDQHFALDAQASTYHQVGGDFAVSIKPEMEHNHPKGWNQSESYLFAKYIVSHGTPWVKSISTKMINQNSAQAEFQFDLNIENYKVVDTSIHYSTKLGHTHEGDWVQAPTQINLLAGSNNTYIATHHQLPNDVTRWFINLKVDVSLPHEGTINTYLVSSHFINNRR